jgi:hypothetical protein
VTTGTPVSSSIVREHVSGIIAHRPPCWKQSRTHQEVDWNETVQFQDGLMLPQIERVGK